MKNIWLLLKIQLDNKTNILKMTSPKAMLPSLCKALGMFLCLTAAVWFGLRTILNLNLAINAALICLILLVTQILSLVFAVGNVINTLYLNRDNEMLICFPVTPNQLFVSKLLFIYIKEIAVNALMTLPIFITLSVFLKPGICYYLSLPIFVLLLPIFPIVIAAFLSIPVMWVINFLKKHALLSIAIIFSLVCACLWGYLSAIGSFANEFNITDKQIETVLEINDMISLVGTNIPLYYQLGQAMLSFHMWYWFPIFMFFCAIVSTLAVLFTRKLFFDMAMTSLEKTIKVKSSAKVKKFKKRTRFMSLLRKELLCVFRSSSEVFEYFLFTILMPFIVFAYDKLLMSIVVDQSGINMIAGSHIMVVAITAMLSNISSASAISRDGGNFHTSKTIPVDFFTQMFVKFSFNAIFTIGAIILTAVISMFIYPAWQILLGSIAVAMAAVGHIAYSISCDIKNPTINAVGDDEASTVSKSTTKCLIVGLLIGFILGMIVILMSNVSNQALPYWVIITLSFLYMVNRIVDLVLRINYNYDKIEM